MSRKKTAPKASPGRAPHVGRRPKARVIGPDVLCAQPKPPRKLRVRKPPAIKGPPRVKRPPALVPGPPTAPSAPASGSAVRSMAGSLAAAKLAAARRMLKEEADLFRRMDMLQSLMFFAASATALFLDKAGLAVLILMLAVGTFAPMLIRRGIAKWRDRLMP